MSEEKRPHLSPSQLDMISKCGQQYYFRYIKGLIRPPGVALLVGGATHTSVETDLTEKMESGNLLEDDAVKDIAADALKIRWADEPPGLDADEKARGPEKVKGIAIDLTVALSLCHHKELAPEIEPVALERGLRYTYAGMDYDMLGFLDIQEKNRIRDTKTRGQSPQQVVADRSTALTFYCMAAEAEDKARVEELTIDALVKTKKPKVVVLKTTRDESDYDQFLARWARAEQIIKAGVFAPCATDNWACTPKWCGYYDICPFGKAKRRQF
ncbi:MAG: PD-(D/E)XK nuclease family protein [Planctomycetota bacterium]|nr:PD-(D/E)XK nuclease family protein [Planctomycetota bacterium]